MSDRKPKFINTLPEGNDLLKGAPHKKIADEIAKIINNDSEKRDKEKFKKKIIGLSGEWGSGKSNIVKMLEDECLKDDKYLHYIYDAWAHQEDLNRRALLEEVEFVLNDAKIIDIESGDWKQRHDKLLAKSRTTNKQDFPEIKPYYIILVVGVVIQQILKILFSLLDFDIFPNWSVGSNWKEFWIIHFLPLCSLIWAIVLGAKEYRRLVRGGTNMKQALGHVFY